MQQPVTSGRPSDRQQRTGHLVAREGQQDGEFAYQRLFLLIVDNL